MPGESQQQQSAKQQPKETPAPGAGTGGVSSGEHLPAPVPPRASTAIAKVPPADQKRATIERYTKAGTEPFGNEIQEVLGKPVDPKIVEITPDGRIYIPAVHFRRVLNEAFGRGGWVLIPWSDRLMKGQIMYREYALYALGQFVGETVGEQEYIEKNKRFTYGDAAEGCESNALMRCAKKLDIYSEVWDPGWRDKWKRESAVCVKCTKPGEAQPKYLWKRKDRGRLYSSGWKEIGADVPEGGQRTTGGSGGSRPASGAKSAGEKPKGQPDSGSAGSKTGGTKAGTRDPNTALYAQVMAGLKRATHSNKDDDARNLLNQLTGKRRCHDLKPETLKALLSPLHKISKDEARVEVIGKTTVVIDVVTSAYMWPPGYTPPDDAGPQAPSEPEAPPESEASPEDGAPPLGDEDIPPSGGEEFGF